MYTIFIRHLYVNARNMKSNRRIQHTETARCERQHENDIKSNEYDDEEMASAGQRRKQRAKVGRISFVPSSSVCVFVIGHKNPIESSPQIETEKNEKHN